MYKRIFLIFQLLICFNSFSQIDLDFSFKSDEKVSDIISYENEVYFSTQISTEKNRIVHLYRLEEEEKIEIFSSEGYPINFIETSKALFFTTFDSKLNDRVYMITKKNKCKRLFDSLEGQVRDILYINKDSLIVCGSLNYSGKKNFFISNINGELKSISIKKCPRIFKIIPGNTKEFILNTNQGILSLRKSDFKLQNIKKGNYSFFQEGEFYGIHKVKHDSLRRYDVFNTNNKLVTTMACKEIEGFEFYDYGKIRNSISLIQKSYSDKKIIINYFDIINLEVKQKFTREFSNIEKVFITSNSVFVVDKQTSKYSIYKGNL